VNREPTLNDLIGDEATGAERQRLQRVHEQLLQAGPPPELSEKLEAGPTLGMTLGQSRRKMKRRGMLLLAAAIAIFAVFIAGYASRSNGKNANQPVLTQALQATSFAPQAAQGTLQVWSSSDGYNWPMTLTVVGLRQLAPHTYYEVYLLRHGKPWGSCGTFRVGSSPDRPVTVTLTAPYNLHKGDSWVVTLPGRGGAEPGKTVLRPGPVTA
jgi:Anti-sigma-K factor rskA, C-terminal